MTNLKFQRNHKISKIGEYCDSCQPISSRCRWTEPNGKEFSCLSWLNFAYIFQAGLYELILEIVYFSDSSIFFMDFFVVYHSKCQAFHRWVYFLNLEVILADTRICNFQRFNYWLGSCTFMRIFHLQFKIMRLDLWKHSKKKRKYFIRLNWIKTWVSGWMRKLCWWLLF